MNKKLQHIASAIAVAGFLFIAFGSGDSGSGSETGVPSEVIGKYYNEDGGGYIELKENGEFIWADGNDIMVSGSYYSKGKSQESWGTVYHIVTTPKEGRLKLQWNATESLTKYTNHDTPKYNKKWMLRQNIARAYGPSLFLRDIN